MRDGQVLCRLPAVPGAEKILDRDALAFVAALHSRFGERRRALLAERERRQARFDAGERPGFPSDHPGLSDPDWRIAGVPADLQDRRVEITGPAERKMMINAFNSGASVFMADIEDALSPTAENIIRAQINLYDAVRRTISYHDPVSGKDYALGEKIAVLKVRPRGWHLDEAHLTIDGERVAGAFVDFGLHAFHNAQALLDAGSGPYFYLPKLQHHEEARLWADVFAFSEEWLGLAPGTIKATVLIETLPGAFHAEAILYELRQNIVGLNCGRWDYIFSYIKTHRKDPAAVLPDRAAVTMTVPFMRAYALHVIKVCHRRGAHAIGGMAAQIPVKGDPAANEDAFAKVRADKEREAGDGHDGTWVAHPALVPVAKEVFDRLMPTPNQVARTREDVVVTAADLLTPCEGPKTMGGVRMNVNVGIGYLAAWLSGRGAVPLHNLMEDAATAEISRTQLWQWRAMGTTLDSGETVDAALIDRVFDDEVAELKAALGEEAFEAGRYGAAADLMRELVQADELADFLTSVAYERYFANGRGD